MSDAVVLDQSGSSRRWVLHRPVDPYGDAYVYFLEVELLDDGLSAKGRSALSGQGGQDLPAFFDELVGRWRGWDDVLSWKCLEGSMTVDATHHGRYVALAVTLRSPEWSYTDEGWSARVIFTLEPGEQLRNFARDAASVLILG